MKWIPDTCYCIIECDAPSKNGKFLTRCRVHQNSTRTTDVYSYNLTHRIKQTESEVKGVKRKRDLKETTKP